MKLSTFFCCCRQSSEKKFARAVRNIRIEAIKLQNTLFAARQTKVESKDLIENQKNIQQNFRALDKKMYMALCDRFGLEPKVHVHEIDYSELDDNEKFEVSIIKELFVAIDRRIALLAGKRYLGAQVSLPGADEFVPSAQPRKQRTSCLGDVMLSLSLSDTEISYEDDSPISASPNSELLLTI